MSDSVPEVIIWESGFSHQKLCEKRAVLSDFLSLAGSCLKRLFVWDEVDESNMGAGEGIRTPGQLFTKQLLYP